MCENMRRNKLVEGWRRKKTWRREYSQVVSDVYLGGRVDGSVTRTEGVGSFLLFLFFFFLFFVFCFVMSVVGAKMSGAGVCEALYHVGSDGDTGREEQTVGGTEKVDRKMKEDGNAVFGKRKARGRRIWLKIGSGTGN